MNKKVHFLSALLTGGIILMTGCSTPTITLQGYKNAAVSAPLPTGQKLIVRFKSNVTREQIKQFNDGLGIHSFEMLADELKITEIKAGTGLPLEQLKAKYAASSLVEYATADAKLSLFPFQAFPATSNNFSVKFTPNDKLYSQQWNARNISADKAWDLTRGSASITVAVIDSGVDTGHPDLKANLLPLIDMLKETGNTDILTLPTGETIDYAGRDGNGHGTHVTGIIGAVINNSEGISGIAGNVKILPIKAADYLGATSASIITKSIIRAIDSGARVINISIGGPPSEGTKSLNDAVNLAIAKGVVVVSASGNESNRAGSVITDVTVPAAYPGVIAVAAITKNNLVANYSNGGPEVSIAAPGGSGGKNIDDQIYSTWPTYTTYEGYKFNIKGPYALLSGTSMACPHVAAVAALLFSREPKLTGQKVRVRILSTADSSGSDFNYAYGYGKVNAYNALIENTDDKKVAVLP